MGNEFKPVSHDKIMGDRYEHPSYGVIEIGRYQSSHDEHFFGSSISHHNGIRISVKTASFLRTLSRDWISGDKTIVEFEMSPTQFADAITSLNIGGGTPITLKYVKGDLQHRDEPPYESKVATFNKEFEKDCKDISQRLDSTIQLAKDTKAQKRLISEIESLKGFFANSLPLVNKSFTEQMEHTIKEAKGEVEAFVTHTVQSYGIEAIRKQAPQLQEYNQSDKIKEITQGGETSGT